MNPRIERTTEKKLVGLRLRMSMASYKVADLWATFGKRRNEIVNSTSNDLISLSIYPQDFFDSFSAQTEFEKWAAAEVTDFDATPASMKTLVVPSGLYAVFHYKGLSSDNTIFRYIFEDWSPNSIYLIDERPHFEILGEKYRNNDPESEEEIWIPIKHR